MEAQQLTRALSKPKKVKFKTLWQSAFIKPWAQATVWIIKDFGASIDHQTISLRAKGIQESTFKNTSPLCARKVLTAFPCDWRVLNPTPLNFSAAAAAVKAPLKHKSRVCVVFYNWWNNKVFIGGNIASTYLRGWRGDCKWYKMHDSGQQKWAPVAILKHPLYVEQQPMYSRSISAFILGYKMVNGLVTI